VRIERVLEEFGLWRDFFENDISADAQRSVKGII